MNYVTRGIFVGRSPGRHTMRSSLYAMDGNTLHIETIAPDDHDIIATDVLALRVWRKPHDSDRLAIVRDDGPLIAGNLGCGAHAHGLESFDPDPALDINEDSAD